MIFIPIFLVSGLAIFTLLAAKYLEEKRERPFFVLGIISKSDMHIRELYHRMVRLYSDGKEMALLFFTKRIQLHSKNTFNKLLILLREKREQYMSNLRDSRLLKKPDGLSEFFKNMSDVEKGNGEINDVYEDISQSEKKGLK